jgi:hypothetical protein
MSTECLSRDISFGIAMGNGLDGGRCSIPGRGKRFFSTPQLSDRLYDPPSLLSSGWMGRDADDLPPLTAAV